MLGGGGGGGGGLGLWTGNWRGDRNGRTRYGEESGGDAADGALSESRRERDGHGAVRVDGVSIAFYNSRFYSFL